MNVIISTPRIYDFRAYNYWLYPMMELAISDLLLSAGVNVQYLSMLKYNPPKKRDKFGKTPLYEEPAVKPGALADVDLNYRVFGSSLEEINGSIGRSVAPDLVLSFLKMTYWYPGILESQKLFEKIFPEAKFFATGSIALLLKDFLFEKKVDVLEDSLEILKQLVGVSGFKQLEQISIRHDLYLPQSGLKFFSEITAFGCKLKCPYCINSSRESKLIIRQPDIVTRDIIETARKYAIEDIVFYDDAALENPHLFSILANVRSEISNARFHFPNGLSYEKFTDSMEEMNNLGVTTFALGYEWDKCSKSSKYSPNFVFERMEKLGFDKSMCGINFMIGLPGQTFNETKTLLENLKKVSRGYRIRINEFSPVPLTPWFYKGLEDSKVDYSTEPLWQNNTLLGWRSNEFSVNRIKQLKEIQSILTI
jgi:hypothetical protein